MGKPRIQTRVDYHVKDQIEEYKEERDINQAEAVRALINSGLQMESGLATDGGEVADRVQQLQEQQHRQSRREQRHDALLGAALFVGALVVSGVADGLLGLLSAGAVGLALIVSSLAGYLGDSDE